MGHHQDDFSKYGYDPHAPGEVHHHVASWQFMTGIFIALLLLTFLTVATSMGLNLPDLWAVFVAILIAMTKAALVVGFFMHLHWDKKINAVVLLYCLLACLTFFMFTGIDLLTRDALDPIRAQTRAPSTIVDAREAYIAEHGSLPDDHGHGGDHDGDHADGDGHEGEADHDGESHSE